jgi:ribosome-associated translation inhibitor RaiA
MDVIFHAHHAVISDRVRARAQRAVERAAARLKRSVDAVVRFEGDGRTRRVEIVLHAPRQKRLVAEGRAAFFGAALADAIRCIESQLRRTKRTPKARAQGREQDRARALMLRASRA